MRLLWRILKAFQNHLVRFGGHSSFLGGELKNKKLTSSILKHIITSKEKGQKLLTVLLDPDKLSLDLLPNTVHHINQNNIDFIFVGGSSVANGTTTIFITL